MGQLLRFMYTEMRYRRVGLTQVQLSRRIPEHFFATLMSINWAPVVKQKVPPSSLKSVFVVTVTVSGRMSQEPLF